MSGTEPPDVIHFQNHRDSDDEPTTLFLLYVLLLTWVISGAHLLYAQGVARKWTMSDGQTAIGKWDPQRDTETDKIMIEDSKGKISSLIIEVNGNPVNSEAEYRRAVADSPTTITLTIIEYRNGNRAYLKTDLLPPSYRTRLGINAVTSSRGGVVVNFVVSGTPGMRCRYKSE